MMYAIQSDKQLYDKIINDMINQQIALMKWDFQYFDWGFTAEELKNYFDSNFRLTKYINNQIYPKYKTEIDQLLFERQKKRDLENITTLIDLKIVIQLIQKYDVQDQQLLKQLYQIHKSNDDLTLLQKLVDRIKDNRVKQKFEQSKLYQPTLFAKKKFINIAKQIYNLQLNISKISKQIYAVGMYMSVVNKYFDLINKKVLQKINGDNLKYNLCIKVRVNKRDIKNNLAKDFNDIYIEISSPKIKNKQIETIGINCSDKFIPKMDFPQIDDGYTFNQDYNGRLTHSTIHIGVDSQNFKKYWQYNGQDTLQHELIHVFELAYGYKNKNLNYIQNQNYEKSLQEENDLSWLANDYYGDEGQFTPYLSNLVSIFRKLFNDGMTKESLITKLKQVDFTNSSQVDNFSQWVCNQGIYSDSAIVWLYHVRMKDKTLFDYAFKKLINKILKF